MGTESRGMVWLDLDPDPVPPDPGLFEDSFANNLSDPGSEASANIADLRDAESPAFTQDKSVNINNNINYVKEFPKNDLGPYYIFVEGKGKNIGNFHPMALGRFIKKNCCEEINNNIMNIQFNGKNRIKIEFKNCRAANLFLKSTIFSNLQYKVYIPNHLVTRQGVISQVDKSITEEYLKKEIISSVEILNVRRINRYVTDESDKSKKVKVPTATVVITFKGKYLPDKIVLDYSRCFVKPYIAKVVQCRVCMLFGHVAAQCRRKQERCPKCAGIHPNEPCTSEIKCLYCKNPKFQHSTNDVKCPRYIAEKEIKKYMAYNNVSYKEAKPKIMSPSYYEVLSKLSEEEAFPTLVTEPSYKNNYNRESNKYNGQRTQNAGHKNSKRKKIEKVSGAQSEEFTMPSTSTSLEVENPEPENFPQNRVFLKRQYSDSGNQINKITVGKNNDDSFLNFMFNAISHFINMKTEIINLNEIETKMLIKEFITNKESLIQ